MGTKRQQHFTASLESLTVSQEGILSDVLQRARNLFKRKPTKIDFVKNKAQHVTSYGWLNDDKQIYNLLDKWFPHLKVPEGMALKDTVAAGGIAEILSYRGQLDLKDPIGFLRKAMREILGNVAKLGRAVKQESDEVEKFHDQWAAKIVKASDGGASDTALDALLQEAIDALIKTRQPNRKPVMAVPAEGISWFGGYRCVADKKNDSLQDVKDKSYSAPKELPALTAPQIEDALKLIKEALVDGWSPWSIVYQASYVDHSDGSKFWDVVHDLPNVDEYSSLVYWQSAEWAYEDVADLDSQHHLVIGLLTWIDRSINGAEDKS